MEKIKTNIFKIIETIKVYIVVNDLKEIIKNILGNGSLSILKVTQRVDIKFRILLEKIKK